MNNVYVGFVIDMSQSMSKNWKVLDLKKEGSKMTSIKNAFNYVFGYGSDTRIMLERKKAHFFALGMGIKHKESLMSVSASNSEESESGKQSESVRVDRIIDIFSFTRLIPSSEFIQTLKNEIKTNWEQEAKKILQVYTSKYGLDQNIDYEELEDLFHDKINTRSRESWLFQLHEAIMLKEPSFNYYIGFLLNKTRLFRLDNWVSFIDKIVDHEKERYLSQVVGHAQEVFHKRNHDYKDYIYKKLECFLKKNLNQALVNNAIGFSFDNVVKYFDMDTAREIVRDIYKYLLNDMTKNVGRSHSIIQMYVLPFISQVKLGYFQPLDIREANKMGLHLMRQMVFNEVQPFVEKIAVELFERMFTEVLTKQIHNWIYFAERAEITLRTDEIPTFFPDIEDDEKVFNKDFMFGATPVCEAMQMAAARLMRLGKDDYKVIVLLSDGDFKESFDSVLRTVSMLKNENVLIVCFYVSDFKSKIYQKSFSNMKSLVSKVDDIDWGDRSKPNLASDKDLLFKVDSEESIKNALKEVFEIIM